MKIGTVTTLVKDVVIDKYYTGYTVFPKGTRVEVIGIDRHMLVCKSLDFIEVEQPRAFFVGKDELGVD